MKKSLLVFSIAGFLAFGLIAPGLSRAQGAQGPNGLQDQINSLLAQITELTGRLNELRAKAKGINEIPPVSLHSVCSLLYRNLDVGARGDDVSGLQEFLRGENYLSAEATGYYGAMTKEGVAKWQTSEGIAPAGAFGPISRERLKIRCVEFVRMKAAPMSGEAPLAVTFKAEVGGLKPYAYALDFGDGHILENVLCPTSSRVPVKCTGPLVIEHRYEKNGAYTAILYRSALGDLDVRTIAAKTHIRVGPASVGCTKEYRPVCGAKPIVCITTPCNPIPTTYGNSCMMNAEGASLLYEGACRESSPDPASDPQCKAWYDGCNSCWRETPTSAPGCTLRACSFENMGRPYCTAWFDSGTANKPPVISNFSGPTTLAVGQTATWTIRASDPENGSLSYSVMWGDNTDFASPSSGMTADTREFMQTSTFTHAYARAGVYTVRVVVRDGAGLEARTSSTVRVEGEGTACTLEHNPVCGRPAGCENACQPGMYCTMVCKLPEPKTYSNKCFLAADKATFLHEGGCTEASAGM